MTSVNTKNSENQTVQEYKVQNIEEVQPGSGTYALEGR
jgi:hypothetical protein